MTCDSPTDPQGVAYVQVTPAAWNPTALGDTIRFTALAQTGLRRPVPNMPVTWSSDPPDVVLLRNEGIGVAVGTGPAQVRATINGVSGTVAVNVTQAIEQVVILTYFGNTVSLGDSIFLYIEARDRNAFTVPGVTYSLQSLDNGIATATLEGWVKAVSIGTANVMAVAAGKADTVPIHVVP